KQPRSSAFRPEPLSLQSDGLTVPPRYKPEEPDPFKQNSSGSCATGAASHRLARWGVQAIQLSNAIISFLRVNGGLPSCNSGSEAGRGSGLGQMVQNASRPMTNKRHV